MRIKPWMKRTIAITGIVGALITGIKVIPKIMRTNDARAKAAMESRAYTVLEKLKIKVPYKTIHDLSLATGLPPERIERTIANIPIDPHSGTIGTYIQDVTNNRDNVQKRINSWNSEYAKQQGRKTKVSSWRKKQIADEIKWLEKEKTRLNNILKICNRVEADANKFK